MGKRKVALTFAETSLDGDEDLKPTRRSRRVGNTHPQQTEPNKADSADSDDVHDFVTLPSTTTAATASTAPSTSLPAQRGQRKQQRIQIVEEQQRQAVQRNDEVLRQQEEDDIMRAIELSKLEMEAEQQCSESREEWGSALPPDPQEPCRDSQSPQPLRKSFSSRAEAADVPPQEEFLENNTTESLSSSSSVVSTDCEEGTSPEKVVQTRTDNCTEWQDVIGSANWEDSSPSAGVANCDRGTQPMDNSSETGGQNGSHRGQNGSHRGENSQYQSASHTITSSQPSQDSRRKRLRRPKRHMEEEVDSPRQEQPAKVRKVPTPPDLDETEEEEEDEEIDVVNEGEAMSGQEDLEEYQQLSPMHKPRKVYKLVDTRKPHCLKHPFYAPHNVGKRSYTRVIYQLIQAYCFQLRRAQAKVLTRVCWGNPIVTGNCYSDTLVQRKRGSRACTFYALSDSDEDGKASEAGTEAEAPSKGKLQRRKKKLAVDAEDDADSDFEDFIPAGRRKASTQRRPRQAAKDVVEMLMQDGRCFLEERPDETLSPTLVEDQIETQDFTTAPGDGCMNKDSDLSQPIVRETLSSQGINNQDDSKKSPHAHADSQSSLTDIFGASSNNETDSGKNAVTSSHQSSRSPVTSPRIDSSHRTNEKSENSCEEDSFDEEILTLSTPKLQSRAESFKTCLQKDNSQTKSVEPTQDRHYEVRPLVSFQQGEKDEVSSLRDSSPPTVGPLDASQNYLLPQQSDSTQSLSFEELRYQFYLSEPALVRPKRFEEKTEGGEYVVDLDNLSQEARNQKSMEHPGADRLEEQSPQTKDISTNIRLNVGQGLENHNKIANGLQDSMHKRRSPPSVNKQSSLINNRRATDDEEEITDCESPTDRDSQYNSCRDTRQSEPDEGWDGSGNGPKGDDDKDYDEELKDFENQEDAERSQGEVEENVHSGDDADATVRAEWEEEQDEIPAMEMREAMDAANEEVSPHQGDRHEEGDYGLEEEEGIITDEDREDDAVGETHHSSMIGVECPLCSVTYHIDQIEAHASGCNGPTSPQQEDERLGLAQGPREPTVGVTAGMALGQQHVYNDRNATVPNNNEGLAGPSTAGTQHHRDQTANDKSKSRPMRGVAAKIVREDAPKHNRNPIQDSVIRKRSDPDHGLDEESSESCSESADQLDASLLQLVEDNKLQLRERKRTRAPDRPAKRQKLSSADKRSEASKDSEATELCFLCHQHISKSAYAEHVQEEIDRAEAEKHLEDTSVLPRRGLRSRTTAPNAAGGESSREADRNTDQSGTTSGMSHTAGDFSSWDGEPDGDSDSDDDSSQTVQEDALFNPRLSESPIKAFRPISKQPMNLIDFKNQFNSTGKTARTGVTSRSTSGKRGRRGQGKGRRGGKRKQRKKRGRSFEK
ncbi:uncharacterized protein LOC119735707 isoform X2 [Patiria miniata]|uniref:Uncharacterized protein n=1 Tax=Patiria miniata TaxID=46514 RepID=A0A914AQ29_PATMI|nr:uncharacterized protein LOC119735707 isoform X2 [Patiria miniata]